MSCSVFQLSMSAVLVTSLVVCTHCTAAGAPSPPPPSPSANCHIWGNYTTGIDLLRKMMTQYYNGRTELERVIAADLFNSNAVGLLEVYSTLLLLTQNSSSGSQISALFAATMKQTVTHACEWLLSYGDTFTLFDIDCSDSTQLLLLGSFLRLRPVLDSTYTFLQGFGCETDGSYNDQWLANNVPTYTDELRQLNMLPSNMS